MYDFDKLDAYLRGQDEQDTAVSENLTSNSVDTAEQHAPQNTMSAEDANRYILRGTTERYGAEQFDESDLHRSRAETLTSSLVRGFGQMMSSIPTSLGEWGSDVADTNPDDHPFYQAGKAMDRWIVENFPINPAHANDFTTHLAQGAGSLAGFFAGGFAGRMAKIPAWATTVGLGAASVSAEGVEDYKRSMDEQGLAVDLDQRGAVSFYNAAIGMSEAIPVYRVFNRMDRVTKGGVRKNIGRIAKEGFNGTLEEATQEIFQSLAQNYVASDLVGYEPNRPLWTEETTTGGQVGGVLGFLFSAAGAALGVQKTTRRIRQVEDDTAANEEALKEARKQRDDHLKDGSSASVIADDEALISDLEDRQHDLQIEKSILGLVDEAREDGLPDEIPEGSEEMDDVVGEEESQPRGSTGGQPDPEAATGKEPPSETIEVEPGVSTAATETVADVQPEPVSEGDEGLGGIPSGPDTNLKDESKEGQPAQALSEGDDATVPQTEAEATEPEPSSGGDFIVHPGHFIKTPNGVGRVRNKQEGHGMVSVSVPDPARPGKFTRQAVDSQAVESHPYYTQEAFDAGEKVNTPWGAGRVVNPRPKLASDAEYDPRDIEVMLDNGKAFHTKTPLLDKLPLDQRLSSRVKGQADGMVVAHPEEGTPKDVIEAFKARGYKAISGEKYKAALEGTLSSAYPDHAGTPVSQVFISKDKKRVLGQFPVNDHGKAHYLVIPENLTFTSTEETAEPPVPNGVVANRFVQTPNGVGRASKKAGEVMMPDPQRPGHFEKQTFDPKAVIPFVSSADRNFEAGERVTTPWGEGVTQNRSMELGPDNEPQVTVKLDKANSAFPDAIDLPTAFVDKLPEPTRKSEETTPSDEKDLASDDQTLGDSQEATFTEEPAPSPAPENQAPTEKHKKRKRRRKNREKRNIELDDEMQALGEKIKGILKDIGGPGTMNSGLDPIKTAELLAAGTQYGAKLLEKGYIKFADWADTMMELLDEAIEPFLKQIYGGLRDSPEISDDIADAMDDSKTVRQFDMESLFDGEDGTETDTQSEQELDPDSKLIAALYLKLKQKGFEGFKDNRSFKQFVAEVSGKPVAEIDNADLKHYQELLEAAVTQVMEDIIHNRTRGGYQAAVELYHKLPLLNIRTSDSVKRQAYSTPAPLSWIASAFAKADKGHVMMDNTAGNGALLAGANRETAIVNELDPLRVQNLEYNGFTPSNLDAVSQADAVTGGREADRVVVNPPFEKLDQPVEKDGYQIVKKDHQIAAIALDALKDDGKATLIVGATKERGGMTDGERPFFNWLYAHYNVVDHFEVDGKLYERMGAKWPVRVLVIDGRQQSEQFAPPNGTVERIDSWDGLYERYERFLESTESADGILGTPDGGTTTEGTADGNETTGGGNNALDAQGEGHQSGGQSAAGSQPSTVGAGTGSGQGAGQSAGGSQRDRVGTGGRGDPDAGAGDRLGERGRKDPGKESRSPEELERTKSEQLAANSELASNYQVPYKATSNGFNEGILTPRNLGQSIHDALTNLETTLGKSLDEYVTEQLGYDSVAQMHKGLMGLQVDAVAASIFNIKRGQATIIADQTGVGKGRQAAAILRYALEHDLVPVFITVDPALYTDMWRDLNDIGEDRFKPLIFNDGRGIEIENALGEKESLFKRRGSARRKALELLEKKGHLPEDANAVFVSYPQLNKLGNLQQRALSNIMDRALLVMDESHKAAGDSNTGSFFRSLVQEAKGTVFLSATWAKRPDNVPLYGVTALGEAVTNIADLPEIMQVGGLPMQTIVSNMLAREGQLFRRERSFKGIEFKTKVLGADNAVEKARQVQVADTLTDVLRRIVHANQAFLNLDLKKIRKTLQEQGGSASGSGNNQASNTINAAPFTSVSHNAIANMLYTVKLDVAIDAAIEAHRRGEKPFLVVDKTFGSFHDEFVRKRGLTAGNKVDDFGFHLILQRMTDRSRMVTIKNRRGKESKHLEPMENLNPATQELYRDVYEAIEDARMVTDTLAGSPIDYVLKRLKDAGLNMGEITGRDWHFDERDGAVYLEPRVKTSKTEIVRQFNSGHLDGLLVNRSGSTGLSMHASEKFTDQKPRHMIVLEADLDINQFMQMLGRINRHGQVELPLYTLLQLSLPAEKRVAAILAMKMQSLNANTSSDTESDNSLKQVVDMLNKYGDEIVRDFLLSRPDIQTDTGFKVEAEKVPQDLAKKFYNRLSLMPVAYQEQVYEEVEPVYMEYIEFLDKTHQNELKPKVLDLDAVTLESNILVEGKPGNSVFARPVRLDKLNVKMQGKPPRHDEVQKAVEKALADKSANQQLNELVAQMGQDKGYITDIEGKMASVVKKLEDPEVLTDKQRADLAAELTKLREQKTQYERYESEISNHWLPQMTIGSWTRIRLEGTPTVAVVTGIQYRHKAGSGNPFAPSKISVKFMVNNAVRQVQLPLSKLLSGQPGDRLFMGQMSAHEIRPEAIFTGDNKGGNREDRYMITDNLLQGVMESERRGQVVSFTDSTGSVKQGYLLPRNFDPGADVKDTVVLKTVDEVLAYVAKAREVKGDAFRLGLRTRRKGTYVALGMDNVELVAPKSKRAGGDIWSNDELLAITGDFVSRGDTMRVTVPEEHQRDALAQFMKLEPLFIPRTLKPVLDAALGRTPPPEGDVRFSRGESRGKVKGGMKANRVKSSIAETARAFKPRVRVVQLISELPDHVISKAGQHSEGADNVKAVYDPQTGKNGTLWMVADHLANPAEARRKLIHEATHYGLRRLLKDSSLLRRTLRQIGRDIPPDDLKRIAEGYELDTSKREDYLEAVEEVLAHYAETAPEAGWFRRAVAKLRRLLRQVFPSLRWSKNDVHALLSEARKAASEPVGQSQGKVRMGLAEDIPPLPKDYADTFYSALEQATWMLPMERGTGQQFLKWLIKAPGVRKEEMDWIGLTEWLEMRKDRKVTDRDIRSFVVMNDVKLSEQVREYPSAREFQRVYANMSQRTEWIEAFANRVQAAFDQHGDTFGSDSQEAYKLLLEYQRGLLKTSMRGEEYGQYTTTARAKAIGVQLNQMQGPNPSFEVHGLIQFFERERQLVAVANAQTIEGRQVPKYGHSRYVIEDSDSNVDQNYREILLSIPTVSVDMGRRGRFRDSRKVPDNLQNHFEIPNLIFHAITKDRRTPDGEVMLHIEELQSDWHQKANKAKFPTTKEEHRSQVRYQKAQRIKHRRLAERADAIEKSLIAADDEQQVAALQDELVKVEQKIDQMLEMDLQPKLEKYKRDTVLVPPFRKSWRLLAFKRLLRFAAENGYDGITWVTGDQVGRKYDKVNVFDELKVRVNPYSSSVFPPLFDGVELIDSRKDRKYLERTHSLEKVIGFLNQMDQHKAQYLGDDLQTLLDEHNDALANIEAENLPDRHRQLQLSTVIESSHEQLKRMLEDDLVLDTPIIDRKGNKFFDMLYNRQLPSEFGKYVKQYDGKVELITVEHGRGDPFTADSGNTREVHGIKMTPALLKLALHKGQPMFARDLNQSPQLGKTDVDDVSLLDRLFRLPFRLKVRGIGGVGQDNVWKLGGPGVDKLVDNLGEHYQQWGQNPEGSVTKAMHTAAETAAWGLLDRRQSSQEFQERDFARDGERRTWLRKGMRMIDTMIQSGVNAREARVMYDLINGEINEQDPRLGELSAPVRDTMREIGRLAVEYGLISQTSFDRYEDKYLHRSYMKYENFDQTGLQRWVEKRMKRRLKKQYGDTLKGRGMFKPEVLGEVVQYVNELNPDWYAAQVKNNNPKLDGVFFKVLEKRRSDGKVAKRVYWPEELDVPAEFADLTEQPVMVVRAVKGNTLYLFRDWTREEREQMGEIFDVRYAVARMFHTMGNDLANGHFYKDIAENDEWSIQATPENLSNLDWIEPPKRWNTLALSQAEWIKVPATKIPKSNTFLWGKLGGSFNEQGETEPGYLVRPEVWRDLNELYELNRPTFWRRLLMQWKLNKTTRTPGTHVNNVMSNFILADLMDVRFEHLYEAVMAYARGDTIVEDAEDMGVFGTSLAETELREQYLKPLLKEIRASSLHTVNQPAEQTMMLLGMMGKASDQVQKLDGALASVYQFEDDVFRLALYIKRIGLGDTKAQAALAARNQFVNYDIRAPWINMARQSILPFISYTYRVIPLLGDAFRKRPWKFLKYVTITWMVLNQLAYWWDDEGDEDEERRALPEHLQGSTIIGTPKMMRLPFRDFFGDPIFMDVSRWIPGGDLVELNSGHSVLPVPETLQWGGPLMIGIELMMNRSAFTGENIVNELSDTPMEKLGKGAAHAWRGFMPNIPFLVPGSYADQRVDRAIGGGKQPLSTKPYDLTTELLNSTGVKVRGQNTKANKALQGVIYQRTEREIRAAIKALERRHGRGELDDAEFREGVELQKQHIRNLKRKIDKDQGRE